MKKDVKTILVVIYIMLSIVLIFNMATKAKEYKDEINKRTDIMNSKFTECLKNVNIKQVTAEDDGLPLFDRYIKSSENLIFASSLITETSYAIYDDEYLIGYRKYSGDMKENLGSKGQFARALRLLSLYLEEAAKNEEKIEPEKADKIEGMLEKVINSLDDKEQCQEYMSEFVDYVTGELNN